MSRGRKAKGNQKKSKKANKLMSIQALQTCQGIFSYFPSVMKTRKKHSMMKYKWAKEENNMCVKPIFPKPRWHFSATALHISPQARASERMLGYFTLIAWTRTPCYSQSVTFNNHMWKWLRLPVVSVLCSLSICQFLRSRLDIESSTLGNVI